MDRDRTSEVDITTAEKRAGLPPAPAARPASPCVRVCTLDDDKICVGCGRSMAEIVAWPRMSADEQHALLGELERRRSAAST